MMGSQFLWRTWIWHKQETGGSIDLITTIEMELSSLVTKFMHTSIHEARPASTSSSLARDYYLPRALEPLVHSN
jgi:hypothetical protein